jgi:hypothetical protein
MAYPVWINPSSGSLGKIAAQQFYQLDLLAVDLLTNSNTNITFSLIAGLLPKGLQLTDTGRIQGNPDSNYLLEGVPFSVNQDVTSEFTIRATNTVDNTITDRTFSITVTGNNPPQILTDTVPLGIFLDGTEVSLQLEAVDLNADPLVWSIQDGSLPNGLSLDSNGLISGYILPISNPYNQALTGWSESKWSLNPWEFATRSSGETFNFTAAVTDGKVIVTKNYIIKTYSFSDLRADNLDVTADNDQISVDVDANRIPILLTKDLGNYSTTNSGGYFAFQFKGIDYSGYPVQYNINTGTSYGWDGNLNWDMGEWDRDSLILPPGLTLDTNTGWLTGYIPPQSATQTTYSFGIYVSTTVGEYQTSATRLFTLNILGNLDLNVSWITDSDLGSIDVGVISHLSVQAVAKSGRQLTYSLNNDSKLPQGLQLLSDGTLSGRVSFQRMSYDKGTTTFDVQLAEKYVYSKETNFDNIYSFSVTAQDYTGQISSSQTFTIRLNPITFEPYENLYIKCLPAIDKRDILEQIINNTDAFDPADVYRPLDPYFGLQQDIKFLVSYGLKASQLSDYISAMQTRHFPKKFYFGEYKLAQAKDSNGTPIYDAIYVELYEDTKAYSIKNGIENKLHPAASTNLNVAKPTWKNPRAPYIAQNQIHADSGGQGETTDTGYVSTNSSYYLRNPMNMIYPNDLTLMQLDITNGLTTTDLSSLPEWMISIQDSNNKVLGYTSGAVLAYMKPGTGKKALYNLNKFVPYDIKLVPFISDRYILNNSYTNNFDISTRKFYVHKYTTFDENTKGGLVINPSAIVDIAVDRPFDTINNQTLDYIVQSGGLDGITYNLDKKLIIFSTQEAFTGWGNLVNDGWNMSDLILNNYRWDDTVAWDMDVWDKYQIVNNVIVPGYLEKINNLSLVNQRGGVWQISIDSNNYFKLNFVQEILPGSYVQVNTGETHSNSFQLYDINAINQGFTQPRYVQTHNAVLQPRVKTTFDKSNTVFINNIDSYTLPLNGDKYLKFPKIGVFTDGQ